MLCVNLNKKSYMDILRDKMIIIIIIYFCIECIAFCKNQLTKLAYGK